MGRIDFPSLAGVQQNVYEYLIATGIFIIVVTIASVYKSSGMEAEIMTY